MDWVASHFSLEQQDVLITLLLPACLAAMALLASLLTGSHPKSTTTVVPLRDQAVHEQAAPKAREARAS